MPEYTWVWRILNLFKILFASFLSFFMFISTSNAEVCLAGYYMTGNGNCEPCEPGTYKPDNGNHECSTCPNHDVVYTVNNTLKSQYLTFYRSGATAPGECYYQIDCPVYWSSDFTVSTFTYWNGSDCVPCPDNYKYVYNGGQVSYYIGALWKDSTPGACTNCCEPNIYTITLTAIDPDDPSNKNTRILYVKYGVGFSEDKNSTNWPTGIDHDILPTFPAESSWWLNETSIFSGYYNEETMIIDGSGGTKAGNDQIKSDIEAKAKFNNAVQYTVNYKYNDEPDGTETQSCYYVREGRKCTAKNFNNSKYSLGNKVFAAWCLEKSGNTCTKRIEVGGDIPRPKKPSVIGNLDKQSVTLTPILEDCPAGYYCQAGNKTACPGGTTSDSGASSINDCYLKGGVTQMCGVFNGKTQCATLDSGTDRIYY